jgi:plasmid stability protein
VPDALAADVRVRVARLHEHVVEAEPGGCSRS